LYLLLVLFWNEFYEIALKQGKKMKKEKEKKKKNRP
jgi:hypothetical protein